MALPPATVIAEAEAINEIYSLAFTALGVETVAELLDIWGDTPTSPNEIAKASAAAIQKMLKVLGLRREHTRRIALTYYRLTRALWTGHTIQDAYESKPASRVELDQLRSEFFKAVESLAPDAIDSRPKSSGNRQIDVEEIDDLQDLLKELDDHLEEVAQTNMLASGSHFYQKQHKKIDTDQPAKKVDKARDDLKRKTGAKVASLGEMSVLDSARRAVDTLAENDDRVLGYVRVSRTGTPCPWCAMLISRGLILYSSARSAQLTEEGHDYHPNCHCYAVPVYSEEQYEREHIFDLNRRYDKLWGTVTKGVSSKDAANAWRRYFRAHPSEVRGAPGARPN